MKNKIKLLSGDAKEQLSKLPMALTNLSQNCEFKNASSSINTPFTSIIRTLSRYTAKTR